MELKTLIIKGNKDNLEFAYKLLQNRLNAGKATIYKFRTRYRMMVVGFLSVDEMKAILNDSSLKIMDK
jgi:hypothetical protein